MLTSEKKRVIEFLSRLADGFAKAIGDNCEIVVHDFSDPEHSIVAIANGHITGRAVGDTLDVLALQHLKRPPIADLVNYPARRAGRALRSSSIFLRDEDGEIFGSVCFNVDITDALNAVGFLKGIIKSEEATVEEDFEHTVDEVLGRLMQSAIAATGKSPADLNREEKITVISLLEAKGAFLIRYSVDRVAELLSISKYTLYNYLEEIKGRHAAAELAETKSSASR